MSDTDKLKCELYDEVVNEKNKQYIELACRFRETCNDIKKKDKEIERLNNIINELEKYLIEEIEDYDKHINSKFITAISKEQYEGEKVCFEDMLGRLQELKGSDKN